MIETRLDELRAQERPHHQRRSRRSCTTNSPRAASRPRSTGRQKQPYSVWRKMERKSIAFEQLSDIFGFRVIVEEVEDCYRALGVVHTKWPTVPGRFKDYISTPKQNDYRSIHTTVVGPGQPARRAADPHRSRCTTIARIRHRRACALQGRTRSTTARC